jgi:acyl carrier protein
MTDHLGLVGPDRWPSLPGTVAIDQILDLISHSAKIPRSALVPDAKMDSLNIASLDMVEILFGIEEKFDVYISMGDELIREVYLGGFIKVLADQIQGDAPRSVTPG